MLITATICKHIHLVALHNSSNHTSSATTPAITNTITAVETTVDSDVVLSCLHDEDEIYSRLATKLASITVKIPSCSVTTLGPVEKHINAIISLINTDQYQQTVSASFNTSMPEPSNKQIPKQKPFFSTRKHNRRPTVRIAKPDDKEKNNIISSLKSGKQLYITKEEIIRKFNS